MTGTGKRLNHWLKRVAVGASFAVLGVSVGAAAMVVFAPPREVLADAPYTFVELVDGTVSSSMKLNTVSEWVQLPVGSNLAAGTVTGVSIDSGAEVVPGSVLYSVNLRPVVVAAGPTPAFRTMSRGTDGADVQQLQQLLAELGFYDGARDGGFGSRTEAAVREWQEELGIEQDGVVRTGDLIFVPMLPGRVTLDSEMIFRGASLAGGEEVLSGLASEPTFSIPVTSAQAASMPVGTPVQIESDQAEWSAIVAGHLNEVDQVLIFLEGIDGAPICGSECGSIPIVGKTLLHSEILTQAPVSGVIVPTAGLLSGPSGDVQVIDRSGRRHEVEVIASARGMSVIEGAVVGMSVRIPAQASTEE